MPFEPSGQTQSEFMSECMSELAASDTERSQEQMVAICLSKWRERAGVTTEGPYGEVAYADPGYQEDKKPRYPIDTEGHIRAAWNYIARKDNQSPYTFDQVKKIKQRIVAAWRAKIDEDGPPGLDEDEHLKKLRQVNSEEIDVPTPEEGETREDFVDRCLDEVMEQDVEEEHASSLCALSWENRSGSRRLRQKTHAEIVQGMEFVLSDETPDRMGDIISSKGWDLDNFRKNPVALFNHRSDFPVGVWENLRAADGALRGHLKLAPLGTSERIDEIRKLVEAGILKAVSVGFKPISSIPRKVGDKFVGEHFQRQELVETSLVSVPANPNALAIAKSLDISTDTLDLVFAEHGKGSRVRQRSGVPGKHAAIHESRKESAMSLAKRIEESHARLNALRDELTDHLSNVDDNNVSDAQLEKTNDLNQRIGEQQKHLAALVEAEKNLAESAERRDNRALAVAARATNGTGEHGRTVDGRTGMITRPNVQTQRAPKIPEKAEERLELIVRAGVIAIIAHQKKRNIEDVRAKIAEEYPRYADDCTKAFTAYTARAESAPAMTTVDHWAAELVQQIHGDYLELLMPKSVYPSLAGYGLSLTFGRAGRISIPTRDRTPSISGSFVGEGRPIPVRQAAFTAQVLTPKKMAVITTWTREIDESSIPAIEGLLRNAIQEDTAITLDSVLLDNDPADAIRPAGLLNGITPIGATAGGGFNALVADMKALSGSLLSGTLGNIRQMVWIMNPQQVLSASLTAMPGVSTFPFKDELGNGRLLTYPIIESGTVPLGTIIALDAADFVTVGGEAPRFEVSDQATLHMEDTDPEPIHDGAPANPVRSLWQTDSLGLRLILPINWTLRRPGVVAAIENVTW